MNTSLLALLLVSCARPLDAGDLAGSDLASAPLLVASGDPAPDRALVWVRAAAPAWIQVEVLQSGRRWLSEVVRAEADTDFAANLAVANLPGDAHLAFRAIAAPIGRSAPADLFAAAPGGAVYATGRLRTAPRHGESRGVSLVVGGDLGGQGWCRPPELGYTIFSTMASLGPDLFLANGDMIYADGACPALAPDELPNLLGEFPPITDPFLDWSDAAAAREIFFAHWRYNRMDEPQRSFLAETPLVAQWDDHEVVNDFGAPWGAWYTGDAQRSGYASLVAAGRDAFFAWNPLPRDAQHPDQMYRSLRWGRHLEIFVVDGRSYRDLNTGADEGERTLLGDTQRDWLVAGLLSSEATWKLVSVDVPISIPTGSNAWKNGRDGWANGLGEPTPEGEIDRSMETGYESELKAILAELDRANITGLVFVSTDVHYARSIAYSTDADGDGDALKFHEFISGPLRAWKGSVGALDPTFGPTSLYAEANLHNFARLKITPTPDGTRATLTAEVFGEDGQPRPDSLVVLEAP